jgi:hypothetical protein
VVRASAKFFMLQNASFEAKSRNLKPMLFSFSENGNLGIAMTVETINIESNYSAVSAGLAPVTKSGRIPLNRSLRA